MTARKPNSAISYAYSGFPEHVSDRINQGGTPYLAAYNCQSSLVHTVQTLNELGITLRRARVIPDIGRSLEPETRLHSVVQMGASLMSANSNGDQVRVYVNIREDNRLHRFLPLLAIGMAPKQVLNCWNQGRPAPGSPWDREKTPVPYSLLEGYHRFYLEPGAMPADWTNQITPAERVALQICLNLPQMRDPGEAPERVANRMLSVYGSGFEERDNPLAGLIVTSDGSLISQMGTVLELVEVLLTQAMLTIAGGDMLGGFDFVIPLEPPEGRPVPLVLDQNATPDKVARWYNSYPHRKVYTFQEQYERRIGLDKEPPATRWAHTDPDIKKVTERIAAWYRQGSVEATPWDRDGVALKYKLASEPLSSGDMLSLARAYLPEFIPDYPAQIYTTGGMNVEGLLLGLIARWISEPDGSFLGMTFNDWELFTLDEQVILCSLIVQRARHKDQMALFETALRLLSDFGIKTWIEQYRMERIGLDRPDSFSPLAQLGFSLPLGGFASLHAPSLKIRIPRDYTTDPDASLIDSKLAILERLFVPAHIPVQHIWEVDWIRLGETAYLQSPDDEINPDLVPSGVRLYNSEELECADSQY